MEVFQKINTLYRRYAFEAKDCPNTKWLKMRNKIILGDFSDKEAEYLFNCQWEAYSKIDGTCSKICFYPSSGEIKIGGKTDNTSSMHGQFEMLQEIADRIKPILCEMFPKESARFTEVKGNNNKVQYYDVHADFNEYDEKTMVAKLQTKFDKKDAILLSGLYGVELEEVPIYIYGEYFGEGIQKCGKRYIEKGNAFRVFDIRQQGWWTPKEVRDEMCKQLGLETVPYLGNMTLREIENLVRGGFTTKVDGAADPTLIEEGIVARPTIPLNNGRGNRIIVKVKYCDYIEYDTVRKEFTDEEFAEFETWYKEHSIDYLWKSF